MCVPYLYCDRRKWFWLRFVWLIRKPQVFRIYNGTSVPFETMGERVNSSRDVVAHWTGMSGDVRQLQRFPMSGFQVTPLVCDATWGVGHKSISCSEEWRIRRQSLIHQHCWSSSLFLAKAKWHRSTQYGRSTFALSFWDLNHEVVPSAIWGV